MENGVRERLSLKRPAYSNIVVRGQSELSSVSTVNEVKADIKSAVHSRIYLRPTKAY